MEVEVTEEVPGLWEHLLLPRILPPVQNHQKVTIGHLNREESRNKRSHLIFRNISHGRGCKNCLFWRLYKRRGRWKSGRTANLE